MTVFLFRCTHIIDVCAYYGLVIDSINSIAASQALTNNSLDASLIECFNPLFLICRRYASFLAFHFDSNKFLITLQFTTIVFVDY